MNNILQEFQEIKTYKNNNVNPDTKITIPLNILKAVSKIIPKKIVTKLQDKGIDIDQIIELRNNVFKGTLIEIEENEKNEKTVISIE